MPLELYWLTLTTLFTGLLWVPYIIKTLMEIGIVTALKEGNGAPPPKAEWAVRCKKAHANAVENLVIFASLVLTLQFLVAGTALTAMAAMVYFYARVVHAVIYVFGLPVLRSVSFFVGVACQLIIGLTILGLI